MTGRGLDDNGSAHAPIEQLERQRADTSPDVQKGAFGHTRLRQTFDQKTRGGAGAFPPVAVEFPPGLLARELFIDGFFEGAATPHRGLVLEINRELSDFCVRILSAHVFGDR